MAKQKLRKGEKEILKIAYNYGKRHGFEALTKKGKRAIGKK